MTVRLYGVDVASSLDFHGHVLTGERTVHGQRSVCGQRHRKWLPVEEFSRPEAFTPCPECIELDAADAEAARLASELEGERLGRWLRCWCGEALDGGGCSDDATHTSIEVAQLRSEVARLREDNERLRRVLAGVVTGHMSRMLGAAALAGYAATVVVANWLVTAFGIVPVGLGYRAPAAVYAVGAAFVLRDVVHETLGRGWALAGIAAGSVLSLGVSPRFAVASAVAFAVSELADFAVYAPLRRRSLTWALVASNAVGLVADSLLFLHLAFGSLAFLPGQVVGKAWATVAALVVIGGLRGRVLSRHARDVVAGA